MHAGVQRHLRHGGVAAHDVADFGHEAPSQSAVRVRAGEVLFVELPRLHQGDGKRVAECQGRGGAGGRREAERAGFFCDDHGQVQVGLLCHAGLRAAGEGDGFYAKRAHDGQHHQDFLAFAGVGDGEDGVVGGNHAEVAVARFGGVDEESGRAGAGKRRRDFFADVAGFAEAGNDDVAARGEQQVAGGEEGRAEVVNLCAHRVGFEAQDVAGVGETDVAHA